MANARQVAPHPLSCLIRSLICLIRRQSGPVIWGRGFAVGSRSRSSCFRPLVLVVMYLLCARAHALLVVRCAVRSLNVTLQRVVMPCSKEGIGYSVWARPLLLKVGFS